ncbi:MAG TPA: ribulokinase [Fimbriimonadaceae bacterium]|nr:ribulokinase [Fimbriimonadaceae bacterium]
MASYALGLDYGTNSVRALIVDTATGEEVGTSVWNYQRGEEGVILDPRDPHLARQHPQDYVEGFSGCVNGAIKQASTHVGFSVDQIVGIGVDTTGSTPIPVDDTGKPIVYQERFEKDPNAMAWLWKDHTSFAEAAEITELAKKRGEPYLEKCGGTYSSEWFWSKILHCARVAPEVFDAAHTWAEAQDDIPGWLCGIKGMENVKRGVCAAGHKAMYHPDWGGLPSEDFLHALDPRLGALRSRLYTTTYPAGDKVGGLDTEIAFWVGLPAGIPVSVGAFDAHLGAVGSGVKPGTMVKIIGTSTCDIMVGDASTPDIPGVCGVVPGSVIPGMVGIEAGQSAVGDLFNWFASRVARSTHEDLTAEAGALKPGQSGLLALDWNNGNRTVLVDPLLTGLTVGQTLHSTAGETYRALIEATAYGARRIIEQIRAHGVAVDEIVMCGGIAEKSPLVMQIYADVCDMPIKTSRSAQTCALGAAIAGSVAGGAHSDFLSAIGAMTGVKDKVYQPSPVAVAIYNRLYEMYLRLHDAFGGLGGDVSKVMKDLLALKREVTT